MTIRRICGLSASQITMRFTKMQGCGNDYIYFNCFEESIENPSELAIRISDRHFGIGGDGIVLIKPSDKADFFMDMYNLDGSRGKMCGNAIRCVGKYVYDHGMTTKTDLSIETLSGIKYLNLHTVGDSVDSVTVDMGEPCTEAAAIPLNTGILTDVDTSAPIIGYSLAALARTKRFTFVSMGNPHAVTFVEDPMLVPLEELGPAYEHHSIFPERANIEFVHVTDRTHIDFRVWERGSGETFACGTGACAAAYASILNGYTDDEVTVKMRGGSLIIRFDRETNHIFMTGPATTVFTGEIN